MQQYLAYKLNQNHENFSRTCYKESMMLDKILYEDKNIIQTGLLRT